MHFEVAVEVEAVAGARAFEGVDLFLVGPGNHGFLTVATTSIWGGTGFLPNLSVSNGNSQRARGVDSTRATLRARRVGHEIRISGTVGDQTLEMGPVFLPAELVVGIAVNGGTADRAVTGRIGSFTVTGGGGQVVSDGFDCAAARP